MATSNAVPFLVDGGVKDALALEMFFGAVLDAFRDSTLLWNSVNGDGGEGGMIPPQMVASKIITEGKSWQFILGAEAPDPEYHTPGVELLGQDFAYADGNVTIDNPLAAHRDIPKDAILKSHWEVVQDQGKACGRALARDFDRKLFSIAAQAAHAAAVTKNGLTVHNGGNSVSRVGASGVAAAYPVTSTGAQNFRTDLDHLAQLMDDDNVPDGGRYIVLSNYIRRVIGQDTTIFDERFTRNVNNSLNQRVIGTMAGFNVLGKTNNIPSTNITANSWGGDVPSKYQGDFTYNGSGDGQPICLAFAGADEGRAPIGYVAAGADDMTPITTEVESDARRSTVFMKAEMMVGANILFPPCAGSIDVVSS